MIATLVRASYTPRARLDLSTLNSPTYEVRSHSSSRKPSPAKVQQKTARLWRAALRSIRYAERTWILRGLALLTFGRVTRKTPPDISAEIFSWSTISERTNCL